VCLLTLLATAAVPAATNASDLRLGLQGGANNGVLSVTNPDPWDAYSTRARPVFGALLEVGIGPNASIAIEPSFVGKGAKYTEYGEESRFEIDYIELPLYAKYRLLTGSVRPYLGAGPSLGFVRRARASGEDIKDQVKSTDASVAFGAGIELASGNAAFFVDGRYAVGLTNIAKGSEDPETKVRNRGLQLRAGVTFRLGGK
jgi:hypothetical protein